MSNPYANNAAGRMATVFDLVNSSQEMPVSRMWWRILKVDPNEQHNNTAPVHPSQLPQLFERMVILNRTVDRIEFQVTQFIPNMAPLLRDEFGKCRIILAPTNWDGKKTDIDAVAVVQLIKVFALLSNQLPEEGTITSDEIAELIKSLINLLAEVDNLRMYFDKEGGKDNTLTDDQKANLRIGLEMTKLWMKKMLRAMIQALELYPFCGITPLDEATAQLLGQRKVNRKYLKFLRRASQDTYTLFNSVGRSAWELFKRAASPKVLLLGTRFAGDMAYEAVKEVVKIETREGVEAIKELIAGDGETGTK